MIVDLLTKYKMNEYEKMYFIIWKVDHATFIHCLYIFI